ncbi:MAG: type I-F CRISPR-associated protein Csy1 [Sedimenticola sp.]
MTNNNVVKLMANEICRYISERRDKKELALLKEKPKKGAGGINPRLEQLAENELGQSNEPLKTIKKAKKEKGRTALEFQQAKYQQLLLLFDDLKLDNHLIDIVQEYQEALQVLKQKHESRTWLNNWSDKAKDISFATHVAKLTHSSSKSTSVYDKSTSKNPAYLTTSTLNELAVDTATANAASAPAGEILTLEVEGKTLLNYIKENDYSPFSELSEKQVEVEVWMEGFKQAYDKNKKKSHLLSKQVYFPVDEEKYHLLMPLVSSSMAHALFLKFKAFFDDENEQIRKQKEKNKYHDKPAISYPNRASLNIPGKPQTASSLNGKRGGRLTLLSSMPPKWSEKQKLPINQSTLFNKTMAYRLRKEINNLQLLLLVIKSKKNNMKKPEMRRAIVNNIDEIANALFDEMNKINLLGGQKGWTVSSAFPLHQQLLLEPDREDEVAVHEKIKKEWQAQVSEDFSAWLNKQLEHKKLNLTPIQQRLWKDLFIGGLREYSAIQELA